MKLVNRTPNEVTWIANGGVVDTGTLSAGQTAHVRAPRNQETRVQFFPPNGAAYTFAEGEDVVTFSLTVTPGADDESGAAAADAES